jgi:hypothetical protein
MSNQYCTTHPEGSPRQAFRAGFREGVKMSLDQGGKVDPLKFKETVWWGNYKRLITWCSVGADIENGLWAMYGARLGCYMTNLTDWDYVNVRDFTYLNNLWAETVVPKFEARLGKTSDTVVKCYKTGYSWDTDVLLDGIENLGKSLRKGMGIEVAELDETQSKFYKSSIIQVPRMNTLFTEDELNEVRRLNR